MGNAPPRADMRPSYRNDEDIESPSNDASGHNFTCEKMCEEQRKKLYANGTFINQSPAGRRCLSAETNSKYSRTMIHTDDGKLIQVGHVPRIVIQR